MMLLPSHASDGTAESYWLWCCHSELAVMRYRCRVMLATVLPSHASDGAAEAAWL
jgi:hypothetical protein